MCFSLEWVERLLIWLVVLVAIIAILKLVIPPILAQLGWAGSLVLQILNIVIWAIVLIAIIIFAFSMIECLASYGGLHLPRG